MKTMVCFVAMLVLALSLLPAAARADIIIDFKTGLASSQGGTISWDGVTTDPLVGTNFVIGAVSGTDTPLNPNTVHVVSGLLGGFGDLDFTTGKFMSYAAGVYTFGPGGSITITGNVVDATTGQTTLLTGSIDSATFNSNGVPQLTLIFGPDTKDRKLLEYFGLEPGTEFVINSGSIHTGDLQAFGGGLFVAGGSFTAKDYLSVDIPNTPVPEPASMLLLGSGLVGVAVAARRKFGKKA